MWSKPNYKLFLVLVFVIQISLIQFITVFTNEYSPGIVSSNNINNTISPINFENKASPELLQYLETGVFPQENYTDRLLILSSSDQPYKNQVIPPIKISGSYLHMIPNDSPSELRKILLDPNVKKIILDGKINQSLSSSKSKPNLSTSSFEADDILGTRKVWENYNITGNDVIIGIIDTGVDFGVSDLSDSALLLPSGITASFDPTGASIGITSLNVSSYDVSSKKYLPLEDENLTIWEGEYFSTSISGELGIRLQDLEITNIAKKSKSGNYQVGIMYQPGLQASIPDQYFLFILVDSVTNGIYDTIYVDFDTSLAISLSREGIIPESGETYLSLLDWDLTDETPFGNFNPIIARDITGDGVNDVSMGGLATTLDTYGMVNSGLVRGIDPQGRGVSIMYDPIGHGTLSAAVAASNGEIPVLIYDDRSTAEVENSTNYYLPGSAPNAKIVSTKAQQSLSEFILGWLWTAGLEPNIEQGGWVVNPTHRVHISSNSWGNSFIAFENSIQGLDFYSLFLDYLAAPNLIYDGYPGMIFVNAIGNSGPGYGTSQTPGTASMAISVGASSMFHFYNGNGGKNDMAWFSSTGPTPYGSIKPDIVAPGNTGFTLHQVITGYGNGTRAAGLFGGTSEATPRTAGVIALLYETLSLQGMKSDLETIRLILKGTAKDLGFHPIVQGNGLISAFDAISSIYGGDQVIVSSRYSSKLYGARLQQAFNSFFVDEENNPIDHPLITNPLEDNSISILPSELKNGLNITVKYVNGTLVNHDMYSSSIQRLLQTSASRFKFNSSESREDGSTNINLANKWDLDKNWKSGQLMQISLSLDESSWNSLLDTGLSIPDLILYDSGTGNIIYDLISQRTWTQQLYSGIPENDFLGSPILQFTDPGYIENVPNWNGLHYEGYVQIYDYINWNAINMVENNGYIQIDSNSIANEFQFASLLLEFDTLSQPFSRVPILLAAEENVQFGENAVYVGNDLNINATYRLDQVYGSFDWGTYPNTGDFRFYRFKLPNNATYLSIQAIWEESGLIPDLYLFNNIGELVKTSDVSYVGGGVYTSKTSEDRKQNILILADDSIYTLLVHIAQTPFKAGPLDLKIYSRYLTLLSIPTPNTMFSQDLSESVIGDLIIDSSNYTISQFPELKVTSISTIIFQGSNGTVGGRTKSFKFVPGVASNISMIESIEYLYFDKGEKVNLNLEWVFNLDVDIYVIAPGDTFSLENDLLSGQGATPGVNFESASFGIEFSGNYTILIDYVGGEYEDLIYTLKWESRDGPTITANSDQLTIFTYYFPNGEYGLLIIHETNFDLSFESRYNTTFLNHIDFTSELSLPSERTISGIITISWSASTSVLADVILKIGNSEYILDTGLNDNSTSFNSALYKNGPATIIVKLSNGIFVHTLTVDVIIDNDNPSTLSEIKISKSKSLPFITLTELILGVTFLIYFNKKNIFFKNN